MMESTVGFWISPDGDIETAVEHLAEVESRPEKYGLTEREISRIGVIGPKALAEWREKILTKVMKKGWLRVRGHRDYTTFEGWGFDDWFLGRVRVFLKKRNYWETDNIAISDLSRQKFVEVNVGELMSDKADTWTFNPKCKRNRRDRYPDIGRRRR